LGGTLLAALHRDERGQLIYLIVFSAAAFVALAALIINSGHMVTRKLETQNAADAAAVSASAWVARALNIVSVNNVAMTELLAVTVVLRALKETWEQGKQSSECMLGYMQFCCEKWQAIPYVGGALTAACKFHRDTAVKVAKQYFKAKLRLFESSIESATRPESGILWKAMAGLSSMSSAVVQAFPAAALDEGIEIGKANKAQGVMLVPLLPTVPAEAGTFGDLCHPTRVGSPSSYPPTLRRGYYPLIGAFLPYPSGFRHPCPRTPTRSSDASARALQLATIGRGAATQSRTSSKALEGRRTDL
jgi:hypothetical protein